MWTEILEKFRNSVVQISSVAATYRISAPYLQGATTSSTGSGFIVDKKCGLVLTNAHVVANAVSLSAIISCCPGIDMKMRLISVCREKDLAVCQIFQDYLDLLPHNIAEFEFGNSLEVKEMEKVVSIGYPLSQTSIKFSQGIISGFQNGLEFEDVAIATEEDNCTFLQTTAAINEGNSGGPLINKKGQVIGVCSAGITSRQGTGYAIPSTVVLSMMYELQKPIRDLDRAPYIQELEEAGIPILTPLGGQEICYTNKKCVKNPHVVISPKLGIRWCPTNDILLKSKFDSDDPGIYVSNVYKYSIFGNELKKGDLLCRIRVNTYFREIDAFIDSNGYAEIGLHRKMSLRDILDCALHGSEIKIWVKRGIPDSVKGLTLTTSFVNSDISHSFKYPHFHRCDYYFISGLCIVPISLELALEIPELSEYVRCKKRDKSYLYVSEVFPGTEASSVKSLKAGDILKKFCGVKIKNIQHLQTMFEDLCEESTFTLENSHGDVLCVTKERAIQDIRMIEGALQ